MQSDLANTKLNQQQLQMLRLFKDPMPEEDFLQMKALAVKLLAKNLDEEMEQLESEKSWIEETYEQCGNAHMRTPYKQ